jgi:hypothetical protein
MSGLGEILANGGLTAGEVGGVKHVRTYSRRAGSCFPTLAPQGWGTHIHGDALGGPPAWFVLNRGGLVRAFPPLLRKDGAPTFTEMLWVGHPPVFVLICGGLVRAFPPLLRKDGAPTFTEMLWVGPPAVFVLIRGGLVRAFPPLLRKDGAPTFTEMLWVGHPPPGYFHLVEELRRNGTLRQHLLDASYGLSGALFVFYEAESYMSVAVVAEAYSWGHGYFGFGE